MIIERDGVVPTSRFLSGVRVTVAELPVSQLDAYWQVRSGPPTESTQPGEVTILLQQASHGD
jgi:hypothetical protein